MQTKEKGEHFNCSLEANDELQAYKTPQAPGKAIGTVRKLLPQSPRKRKAVVFKVAHSSGLSVGKNKCTKGNRGLPKETVKLVKDFFQLDSISRQEPGRKDFVTVKVNNTKQQIQKRHLFWSLRESYGIFMKENPTVQIGFSKFCSLRPVNIFLSVDMPRDVCLRQYHENIKMLCECLHKEIANLPLYSGSFVCNPESELCMLGKCGKCPTGCRK